MNAGILGRKLLRKTESKQKNVIMLVQKGKIFLDEIPLFFPQLSADNIEEIKLEVAM